jgi:hypothetical protein
VIQNGVAVLRRIEYSIAEPEPPTETLFFLRDLRGLSIRLVDSTLEEWREGSMRSILSPLDVHVVSRCVEHVYEEPNWGSDEQRELDASLLLELKSLLEQYIGGKTLPVDWW